MRVTVWLVLLGVLVLMAPVGAPADEPGGVGAGGDAGL